MGFIAPAAFFLAVLIPVIVAMYLLKLRRTEQIISSTYLWRRMVRDVRANAPWQRLRRNLLLFLQLFFLVLLILALARPFSWTSGATGKALILILDRSASMAATDVAPTRLDAARFQAVRLIDSLPDGARVTIIAADNGAQVLVASSQDRLQIDRALEGLSPGTGGSDLTTAMELAAAIAARQPETEITVLSDGRVTMPDRLAIKSPVRFLPVGSSGENQAVGLLSLQTTPASRGLTAFVQVINYGDAVARRRLNLYSDDQLVNVYDLEIPSGGQQTVTVDDLPAETRVVEARLAGEDILPLDDQAWAVQHNSKPASVVLVTEGNLFLETAMSLLPIIELTTMRPSDWEEWQGREAEIDADRQSGPSPSGPQTPALTVLDRYVPLTTTLPTGNLLFVAPPRSTDFFSVTGTVDQPLPQAAPSLDAEEDAISSLLEHVDLSQVRVLEASRIARPRWAHELVQGVPQAAAGTSENERAVDTNPLLIAGEVNGQRVAIIAFDLLLTDLPLQVAFPLLLSSLTGWLLPGGPGGLPSQVDPGSAVSVQLPPEVEYAVATRPDGSSARIVSDGGHAVFGDTAQLGVYHVAWKDPRANGVDSTEQASFAVNLYSPRESDVQPANVLPTVESGSAGGAEQTEQARREWWRLLAFFALGVLLVEWLVYHRAALARLWAGTRKMLVHQGREQ